MNATELAQETLKKIGETLLNPPSTNHEKSIKIILKEAYTACDPDQQHVLFGALFMFFNPETIKQFYPQFPHLAKTLQTQNARALINQLQQKYRNTKPLQTEEGTLLRFLEHAFTENDRARPFQDKDPYIDSFKKDLKRYPIPLDSLVKGLSYFLAFLSIMRKIVLYPASALVRTFKFLTQELLNVITQGIYKQQVLDELNTNGIKSGYIKELKDEGMRYLLRGIQLVLSNSLFSGLAQYKETLVGAAVFLEQDPNGEQVFELLTTQIGNGLERINFADKDKGKQWSSDFILRSMATKNLDLSDLKLVFSSYYKAISQPLTGNKALSALVIKPLQILSAFIVIPLFTAIKLTQLALKAVNYAITASLTLFSLTCLAILLAPIKIYDALTKSNKPKPTPQTPSKPAQQPASTPLNKNKEDPKPQHFDSPLNKKPPVPPKKPTLKKPKNPKNP
jgi:hypothetical protein